MTIKQAGVLRDAYRDNAGLTAALNRALERIGFDDKYVETCIEASKAGRASKKTKYIKDNVWGMVEVDASTMRLIDCPILQRLRWIRQLGVSYLTYPSAEHSRFTHSLGMAAVVGKFIDAIEQRAREGRDSEAGFDKHSYVGLKDCDPVKRADLIHAAILHDVGHFPFSHATESALIAKEDVFSCGSLSVADFRQLADDAFSKEVQLSESISLAIILTKRFEDYYREFVRGGEEDPKSILRLACLIAGSPVTERLDGVSKLISSAIDSDKIDYVSRDARACGIPVGIDTSRVFLRSGFIEATKDQLKPLKDEPVDKEIVFVLNASGVDTLDEVIQARASLYQRVYLHPVTRTAEAVLAESIQWHAENKLEDGADADFSDALFLWSNTDDSLLSSLRERGGTNEGSKLAMRLNSRLIPKKAAAFSALIADMHMPLGYIFHGYDTSNSDTLTPQIINGPLRQLTRKQLAKGPGQVLANEIRAELEKLIERLSEKHSSLLPAGRPDLIVMVGSAFMESDRPEFIILQNGELMWTKDFTRVSPQQDAADIYKSVGYVMCDAEWRPLVLVAARTVLCRPAPKLRRGRLNVGLGSGKHAEPISFVERMILDLKACARRAGVRLDDVQPVIDAATDAGYFDDKPLLAKPVDADGKKISSIAEKLSAFDGEASWRVKPETVAAFLNQFPPALRKPMRDKLLSSHLTFFDTKEIVSSITEKLNRLDGEVDVAALSPNSGHTVRGAVHKYAEHKSAFDRFHFANDITEAVFAHESRPLVLVDDNVSSGVQSSAQLLQWAGVPTESWPEGCASENKIVKTPFNAAGVARLRQRPIKIVVCAGHEVAKVKLDRAAELIGLQHPIELVYRHNIDAVSDWDENLKEFLTRVGRDLLAWSRYERKRFDQLNEQQAAHCQADAFGFRGAGGLLATATNVPSSTVTALWNPGMFNGSPWLPLMVRSGKLRHFVVG